MSGIPHISVVESLMYVVMCTRPIIIFIVNLISHYQSNLGQPHCLENPKVFVGQY